MKIDLQRERLIAYLADADSKKVKELYSLLEEEIDKSAPPFFSEQQMKILDSRREDLLSGKVKGVDWQTIHDNVRKKRKIA